MILQKGMGRMMKKKRKIAMNKKSRKLKWMHKTSKILCMLLLVVTAFFACKIQVQATSVGDVATNQGDIADASGTSPDGGTDRDSVTDNLGISITGTDDIGSLTGALQIVLVLTVLSLCPSILIMVTSFVRILIVLHFTRAALQTQTAPPNQVLVGLALFLTFFIMSPVLGQVYTDAYVPLSNNEITVQEAYDAGIKPIRRFMLNNVKDKDLNAMCEIAGIESVDMDNLEEEIPTMVLIPSFILSELRIAFYIGFLIYIPFIVIDMVVASVLMSMGMMMLPPTTISMPFKILLFVLADGWNLIIVNLLKTFTIGS